jgi:HD domain-containing protein
LEVASLLYYAGATDPVIAAGVLHDVIEDTAALASDLRGRFGRRVTDLVVAVSEDDRIADHDARKAALRAQVAPPVTTRYCSSPRTRSPLFGRCGRPFAAAPMTTGRRHRRRS